MSDECSNKELENYFTSNCEKGHICRCVKKVMGDKVKIIFILESPAKEEIEAGHPACGISGIGMSKVILPIINIETEIEEGFGSLFNKHPDKLKYFGVMNASSYPLQSTIITSAFKEALEKKKILKNLL